MHAEPVPFRSRRPNMWMPILPDWICVSVRRLRSLEPSMGLRAVLYGYLIPLGVLMSTIILVYLLSESEALSALLGIAVLVPYYGGLYLMKDRLSRSFRFRVRKQIK